MKYKHLAYSNLLIPIRQLAAPQACRERILTAKVRIFQKVRMNGNFADVKRIVRDSTGTLLCIIVLAAKDIGGPCWGIELAWLEEFHFPVKETAKRYIDITSTVDIRYRSGVTAFGLSAEKRCTVGEGIGGFGRWGNDILSSDGEDKCSHCQGEKSDPVAGLDIHHAPRA